MQDVLAHTRNLFNAWRVVAGPTRAYAISPGNLWIGPVRETIAEAEADADRFHDAMCTTPKAYLGWGAL